jgi:ATP-dependent helicase HrpB
MAPDDPLKEAPYVAVAALSGGRDGRNDVIQLAAPLTMTAIKTHLAAEVRKEVAVFWAPATKAVLARRQQRLGALVLSEKPVDVADTEALPVLFKVRGGGGRGSDGWLSSASAGCCP